MAQKQSRMVRLARGFGRTFVNVPAWLGISTLREPTKALIEQGKSIYLPPDKPASPETFEQATKRLNLTENDLRERVNTLKWQGFLCLALMVMVMIYAVYLWSQDYFAIGLLALGVAVLSFLRYLSCQFWIAQIKHRRLGLSFQQWLQGQYKKDE